MYPPPNELFTALSLVGFVLCAVPLYWHLHSWNTGTCLYMIWTGLGCPLQCINSIVWNKNTINRAPVYCDILTHIQVALNVAIPACSLCINRRLYKIAMLNSVVITSGDKRRAVIQDLFICIGLPILQIIARFWPCPFYRAYDADLYPFLTWPVAVGTVSLFYCVMAIYKFYKREREFREMMSVQGLRRGRYVRLMALSAAEIFGTIPLGTYIIVYNARRNVKPWKSWANTHSHYSVVHQIPSYIWKNDPNAAISVEISRWALVACAFNFFAFFGFANEARQHYRLVYAWFARCIMRTVPPAPVPPHLPNTAKLTVCASPGVDEV